MVGDPENFQAEHSEREPELVTVKPVSVEPAQTNVLITTTLGHQVNLLLISSGQQTNGTQPVDVLLTYGKPPAGSFLVEEPPFSTSLIAETRTLDEIKGHQGTSIDSTGSVPGALMKNTNLETSKSVEDKTGAVLDKLLERQKQAPLPVLYGQHPGENRSGAARQSGSKRSAG